MRESLFERLREIHSPVGLLLLLLSVRFVNVQSLLLYLARHSSTTQKYHNEFELQNHVRWLGKKFEQPACLSRIYCLSFVVIGT